MNRALLLLFVSVFIQVILFGQEKTVTYYQDGAANPPDLIVTLKNITAHVAFVPEENKVIAATEFLLSPNRYQTDSIVFYAPDFTVSDVTLGFYQPLIRSRQSAVGSRQSASSIQHLDSINWKYISPNLIIYPKDPTLEKGQEYLLSIKYEAKPLKGAIYFIGWKPEEQGKRKEIWAHRPHGWLPYIDARITMDMYYTFDKNYKVFANGERIEVKDNPDDTKTWHYRMAKNHPFFSTSVVIGDYDYKTAHSSRGVPLEFWYYHGQEEKVQPTYQYTEAMLDFFEKELGYNYPYPVYRQAPVIDYMYGAMECTTATVFGDFMLIDPHAYWQRNYINTNAHEMAHQWFGDCIGHLVNKDVWLTESFGTYYAKLFEKSVFGEDYYQNVKNEELNQALTASKTNNYPVGSSMGGVARIYQKGSLVLGMLRDVMGDREFRDAVKLYLKRYGFGYAQTSDFIRCVYDMTGKSYNWFFDEWVLHGGEPTFKVTYSVQDDTLGNRSTRFQVWQVHETNDLIGLFKMPIRFEVHYKDGSSDEVTAWIENKYDEVNIRNKGKKQIDFVLFDPGREIVKKVNFDKSFEELTAQVLHAAEMIDRYDALVALRSVPVSKKKDILIQCYGKEKFHLTKSEIIDQLAGDTAVPTIQLLQQALSNPDALVRKAVLKNGKHLPESLRTGFEKALNDFSYQNQELALDALSASFPGNIPKYLETTEKMEGWRGKNIRMKWLEIAIGSGRKEFLPELISYTGPLYEFETRMNAFSVLKRLRYIDETCLKNAKAAGQHWNNKLSGAAKEYLSYFNEQ